MSRQIDLTKELSDDDRAYLEARDWQNALDLNALNLMGGGADEAAVEGAENPEEDPAEESDGSYKGWHKAEWAAEIEKRNADRADADKIVPESETAAGFKAAVLADDAAHAA